MPQLSKAQRRLKCARGHPLTARNRSETGQCLICRQIKRRKEGHIPNAEKTHCPNGHPYSGDNLAVYMRNGREIRDCRTCRAMRSREYYWNKVKHAKHPGKPGRPRKYQSP